MARILRIRPADWAWVVCMALLLSMWVRSYFYGDVLIMVSGPGIVLTSGKGAAALTVGFDGATRKLALETGPPSIAIMGQPESSWRPWARLYGQSASSWAFSVSLPYWLMFLVVAGSFGWLNWQARRRQIQKGGPHVEASA